MIAVDQGASVEGKKLVLVCRQYNPHLPRASDILNCLVYPFRLSIHAEATINEELDPKAARVKPTSMLTVGDGLNCQTIYGYGTYVPSSQLVQAGAHRSTRLVTRDFAFAEIQISLRTVLNRLPPPPGAGAVIKSAPQKRKVRRRARRRG